MPTREEEMARIEVNSQRRLQSQHCKRTKGSGSIETRRNRPNKYRAKVVIGKEVNEKGKNITRYKTIGSYKTRKMAEQALKDYNENPYDLDARVQTFKDLFEAWSEEYYREYPKQSLSRCMNSAFAYCHEYWDMNIRDIKVGHIKDMMSTGYIVIKSGEHVGERKSASKPTQERIKSMCNLMFDYALEHGMVPANEARKFQIGKLLQDIDRERKVKKVFSEEDIKLLWENLGKVEYVDMILIGIYTGFRPKELCSITISNTNLEENYIIGGMKTTAGTDRVVPIHPDILPLIKRRYEISKDLLHSDYLFSTVKGSTVSNMTYDTYRRAFASALDALGLTDFSPHCTRHTFATQAEICQLRELAIKKILGHSISGDVTMKHYQHVDVPYLYNEICKLSFGGAS